MKKLLLVIMLFLTVSNVYAISPQSEMKLTELVKSRFTPINEPDASLTNSEPTKTRPYVTWLGDEHLVHNEYSDSCLRNTRSSWIPQDNRIDNFSKLTQIMVKAQFEKILEEAKQNPAYSTAMKDWLTLHISRVSELKSTILCWLIYRETVSIYDPMSRKFTANKDIDETYDLLSGYAAQFIDKSKSNTDWNYADTMAIKSVRNEYKKTQATTFPTSFQSNTFNGKILVVSNKKQIISMTGYKGIMLDERNKKGKSIKQTFLFPFSPLNNPEEYKMLVGFGRMGQLTQYRGEYRAWSWTMDYPDEAYFMDINQFIDIKDRENIWKDYFYFNETVSFLGDAPGSYPYSTGEDFDIIKINGIYFLSSNVAMLNDPNGFRR
jgi:hypothetical protein